MTNRIELINYLLDKRSVSRYLEISMRDQIAEFRYVLSSHKKLVSPHTYQSFFQNNTEKFDIILIDGLHTEEQVLKDLANAFAHLATNGAIILHDCMPPDAWHQRNFDEYKEGENWNGDVWKAALRTFNNSHYKCTLLDLDWGCGIIDTAGSQQPALRLLPDKLQYDLHYPWLLSYCSNVSAYIRDEIKVFYHLACMYKWEEIFREQMDQLGRNGFRRINLSMLGEQDDLISAGKILEESGITIELLHYDQDLTCFETPALQAIEEWAKMSNGYVLYLHSKGVSSPEDNTKIKWRRLMMHELVDNWESCMWQLLKYDVVGVNWRDMPPISHFCGNFWYASSRYIRKLANFSKYYENPHYKIYDKINDKRLGCEFWIGSGRETPRISSLAYRNIDFCNPVFWADK
ncbi:MAG: class I SAM-dependent methyltransferase [Chitinophagaceae bacterium]